MYMYCYYMHVHVQCTPVSIVFDPINSVPPQWQ